MVRVYIFVLMLLIFTAFTTPPMVGYMKKRVNHLKKEYPVILDKFRKKYTVIFDEFKKEFKGIFDE